MLRCLTIRFPNDIYFFPAIVMDNLGWDPECHGCFFRVFALVVLFFHTIIPFDMPGMGMPGLLR